MRSEVKLKNLNWIDLCNPSKEELDEIINNFKLPQSAVEDCLEPEHLPKIEKFDNSLFVITRHFDKKSEEKDDDVQKLTRKIAFFLTDNNIITIHRQLPDFWQTMIEEFSNKNLKKPEEAMIHVFYKVLDSYDKVLQDSEKQLEDLEGRLFHQNTGTQTLQKINLIKKKLSVIKHILGNTHTVIFRIPQSKETASLIQDLREELEAVLYRTSSLLDEANNLLQLYISMASHKTNETVRVLTVFSVFFMPLTFIVGIYGMNFKFMPELGMKYGYAGVWVVMICVILIIYTYFKKKGWL